MSERMTQPISVSDSSYECELPVQFPTLITTKQTSAIGNAISECPSIAIGRSIVKLHVIPDNQITR